MKSKEKMNANFPSSEFLLTHVIGVLQVVEDQRDKVLHLFPVQVGHSIMAADLAFQTIRVMIYEKKLRKVSQGHGPPSVVVLLAIEDTKSGNQPWSKGFSQES